ncbi:MAG TPA: hypothetical protein DHW10_01610 [Rhodospirillaceae bacterium]|nr:hypothetical protein [Rhodospirillaceae bacterium]|tara:strand:- start:411 stop:1301 length:891 start_codon:yes stop_codon:yes gene_type:complete
MSDRAMVGRAELALEGALDSQIKIPDVKIAISTVTVSARGAFDGARAAVMEKLEGIHERGRIAELLCDSNRYGMVVLRQNELEVAVDEKTQKWVLRDIGDADNLTAIPQEEIYDHLRQIIITSADQKKETPKSNIDEALDLSKRMLPLYALTTSAAIAAFVACAPAALAVLTMGGVARTMNNSHRYLAARAEYDALDFIDQARVQNRMLSLSTFSGAGMKMMLPKLVEMASFGALSLGGQGMLDQFSHAMEQIISDGLAPLEMLEISSIDIEAEAPDREDKKARQAVTYGTHLNPV